MKDGEPINFRPKRTEADAGWGNSSASRTDSDGGQAIFLKKWTEADAGRRQTKADQVRPVGPDPYEILGSLNVIFNGRGSISNGQFIEGHRNANGQNEFDTEKIFQLQLNHPERIFSPI